MSGKIYAVPYRDDDAPEDYPEGHPMRDPWHHERCRCGHKRTAHYDEHRMCLHGFDYEGGTGPGCPCEGFEEVDGA